MEFRLTSEQEMLRDGVRRYVTTELDYETRRKHIAGGADAWASFAEMGWLMLPVPEAAGGLDGCLEDMALVAEELGRGLALEPFIFGAVLPARLISLISGEHASVLLPDLASGKARFAAALYETRLRYALDGLECKATPGPQYYELTGTKQLVFGGGEADFFVVAARVDIDDVRPSLFIVPSGAAGISRRLYRTIDNLAVADVTFDHVKLSRNALLAGADAAVPVLARAVDEAIVLLCADALGCMHRAIEMTAEYLRIRKQFGQVLAAFQALQHGVANLFIEANEARSLVYRAISLCRGDDDEARASGVSACKLRVLEIGRYVAGQSVHFHGGIGVTCEYPVGEHLRRMLVSEQILGNGQYHLERYLTNCRLV